MLHPLCGADLRTLAHVVAAGGRPDRTGRALGILAAVVLRAPATALARLVPEPRHATPAPLFVLGHWRSGTTHLANLLAAAGFHAAGPLDVGLPHEPALSRLLGRLLERRLPEDRFVDAMPVTPASPQEDEFALAAMSPLSFLHAVYFPRAFAPLMARGVFFDGGSATEIARWERRLLVFTARTALRAGGRLMVKNPAHTARAARLRRLFPEARFVHIARDPLDVFHSMRRFHRRMIDALSLQEHRELALDPVILDTYRRMMTAFDHDTRHWDRARLVEIRYEDLVARPLDTLGTVYESLRLGPIERDAPAICRHLDRVAGWQAERSMPDDAAAAAVARHWGPWVQRYGREGAGGGAAPSNPAGAGP